MNVPFYLNTTPLVPSSATNSVISSNEKHPLSLSDVDRIDITQQFIRKISHTRLGARGSRIVSAVFRQTLDFNKFEDDMNGTRLEQLTQILPQHANQTVRNLEALNILITREGKYGKYLSINFNFAQWGQPLCKESLCNDPTILLDHVKQPYLDQTPIEIETEPESKQKQEQKHDDKPIETSINNSEIAAMRPSSPLAEAEMTRLNDLLNQLIGSMTTLTSKVTQLETQWNNLLNNNDTLAPVQEKQPHTKNESQVTEQKQNEKEAIHSSSLTNSNTLATPILKTDTLVNESSIEPPSSSMTDSGTSTPATVAEVISDISLNQSNTEQPALMDADTATKKVKVSKISLQFPPQFSAEDCQHIEKMLQKSGDKAQLLLDMLRNRLSNTANPVRDPFAYLGGLLRRLDNNRLDMTVPTISATSYDPTLPKPVSALKQCEDDFREAVADYTQMEKNIKLLAAQDELSFQECVRKPSMKDMWKTAKNRVIEAKQTLASLQNRNVVLA